MLSSGIPWNIPQVTRGIFYGIPWESIPCHIKYSGQHKCDICTVDDAKVGCNTVEYTNVQWLSCILIGCIFVRNGNNVNYFICMLITTHTRREGRSSIYKPVVAPNAVDVPVPKVDVWLGVWNTPAPVLLFAAFPNKVFPLDPKPPNDAVSAGGKN